MKKDDPKKSVHTGHRDRARQRFLKRGLEDFAPHEILELLLYYSIPRRNTNEAGHSLLERFGSISGVFDAPYEHLCGVKGISDHSATLIKLIPAIMKEYMNDKASAKNMLGDLDSAAEFMKSRFLDEQRECMYMACLGNNGKILFIKRVAEGSPDTVELSPAELVRTAISANAVHVILAHNHPHGLCNPSRQDIRTTNILFDEFQRVNVNLADHIIVASDGVYSMKKNNMYPGFWQ